MAGIFLAAEQLVDQLGPFLQVLVGDEFIDVGRHWQLAGQIERDSPDKLFVGGQGGRLDLSCL